MTVIGVAAFFFSWLFLLCCESGRSEVILVHRSCIKVGRIIVVYLVATASDIITLNLRRAFVTSVLVQDQHFFDRTGPGEVASRAGKDISTIRVSYGEKMGYIFWSAGTLLAVSLSAR